MDLSSYPRALVSSQPSATINKQSSTYLYPGANTRHLSRASLPLLYSNLDQNPALLDNGQPRKDNHRNRRDLRPRKQSHSPRSPPPRCGAGPLTHEKQGFETIKQLLQTSQPYKVILGARNADGAREAYRGLGSGAGSDVTVLPLELSDLNTVRTFAQQALQSVGQGSIDYLLLNAGISDAAEKRGANGSKWCEAYIVNHLCK